MTAGLLYGYPQFIVLRRSGKDVYLLGLFTVNKTAGQSWDVPACIALSPRSHAVRVQRESAGTYAESVLIHTHSESAAILIQLRKQRKLWAQCEDWYEMGLMPELCRAHVRTGIHQAELLLDNTWIDAAELRRFLATRDRDWQEDVPITISSSPGVAIPLKPISTPPNMSLISEPTAPSIIRTRTVTEHDREVIELISDSELEPGSPTACDPTRDSAMSLRLPRHILLSLTTTTRQLFTRQTRFERARASPQWFASCTRNDEKCGNGTRLFKRVPLRANEFHTGCINSETHLRAVELA
ncbi:hypothetical protein DFH09DRAFT_1110467 [Mycena vulgaris]|nr:hypothetical protein DFH09DRAFT_1110467 [Mycena vulgaris]